MSEAYSTLSEALQRLRSSPVASQLSQAMKQQESQVSQALVDAVLKDIPAFSTTRNPQIRQELAQHCRDHVTEMADLLDGRDVDDFAFVDRNARHRAEQHFPLEAILHAYRCGQRVFTAWFRRAGSTVEVDTVAMEAMTDLAIEYTDGISNVCTSAYVDQVRMLADLESDRRGQLLDMLLHGYDESDGRVAKILGDAGFLDQRRAYCVVVARSVDPTEMLNARRARRLAKALSEAFVAESVHCLVDVRDNLVVGLLSAIHRLSGWTQPAQPLAASAAARLATLGNAVLVGISSDLLHTAKVPSGLRQAKMALDQAGVERRVLRFGELTLRQVALDTARDELRPVLPDWALALRAKDDDSGHVLSDTLRAYADASMNILKAAAVLSVHPNTIYARLDKVRDISGLEPKAFHQLNELLIACDCT
ncbi:MAG: helix-turn-helix domain-containing protein [Pseudomonadota bacterium]